MPSKDETGLDVTHVCARNPNKGERKDICAECNRRKVTKGGLCFVCIDEIKYGDERYEEKDKEREEE